ncbi:hypothetical protein IAI10_15380 [Clostridium sp. 19966]|uniref:hypothetical protein n=1 Tax=Clostridium sp. 19966 TaxID=2768166 RepID=UPI0028DDC985|nr:hypothetical protein [Clostridium sp. 19966]MDT8718047.1 hypothetical protein [Clostridium sp. 19966]
METKNSNKNPLDKLLYSLDNILVEDREQKLKLKLSNEIKNSIFTDEIVSKLNEYDFEDLVDEDVNIKVLFSSIFPVFVKKDDVIFRLYKHKIEVDLSDEMCDRYIYAFSDGRLISGLFQSFNIYDDEYLYGVKKIIDSIPLFKSAIIKAITNFKENIDVHYNKIENLKEKKLITEKNYNILLSALTESKDVPH